MTARHYLLPALLLSFSVQAADLIIADGETYTITEKQRELQLDKFVVGNKATIKFAEGVSYWDMSAKHVDIGRDVVIDGRGVAGASGEVGAAPSGRGSDCDAGQRGSNGQPAKAGGRGLDIQMKLAVLKLGSLKVLLDGAEGGRGGDGGQGQRGGLANSCDPTAGGDGGDGGKGGDGGDGGKLVISLSAASNNLSLMALSHQIEASADAGMPGKGGDSGKGGDGSEGQFINQKTLTGDRQWVSGGKAGKAGQAGEKGREGHEGRIFIGGGELNVTPISQTAAPAAATVAAPAAAKDKELEELKAQMRLMQERLEAMEKQKN